MNSAELLKNRIVSIDGQDYGSCKQLYGEYDFPDYKFIIDQIPGDPYAPPHTGIFRVQISKNYTLFPAIIKNRLLEIAYRDFFARRFYTVSKEISGIRRGTGYSGIITIDEPGQAILERTSVLLKEDFVEICFFMGVPANGRDIDSELAIQMIYNELPEIIFRSFHSSNIKQKELIAHLHTAVDSEFLREKMKELDLISFIADGAKLVRKSGESDLPSDDLSVVPFTSPESLRHTLQLPHAGAITGMGIPSGVILIVGGGYHGKSTLLRTIELGIYNHIPGDGREFCITDESAVKIRAYSGRYVEKVNISPYIKNLPLEINTDLFSSVNASGSTSQAAVIQESIESGAKVLLMDEDTCAANFMIRDSKMKQLVGKDDEPITAFTERIKPLYNKHNISTILVMGGSGDYFSKADTVIQMLNFLPLDVTEKAHHIADQKSESPVVEYEHYDDAVSLMPSERSPQFESIDPYNEYKKISVYASEIKRIHFGKTVIDLTDLEQLMELGQTKSIIYALIYLNKYIDGKKKLKELLNIVQRDLEVNGLQILSQKISGHFSEFRMLELAGALNRLRTLKVTTI